MPQTYVYVDGFNLYFGSLQGTPFKWLGLNALCRTLIPQHSVARIRYFTARVTARPHDPSQPARQQAYLRALETAQNTEIHLGHFLSHEVTMPGAPVPPPPARPKMVRVIKTEEKGSDVNLASWLLHDAFTVPDFEAIVITNDSDLATPIRMVKSGLGKKVGLLCPLRPNRQISAVLRPPTVTFFKAIRPSHLTVSQFPPTLTDKHGTITKPPSW